jgi:hypothetical protein
MDQRGRAVRVTYCAARDVRPDEISDLILQYTQWLEDLHIFLNSSFLNTTFQGELVYGNNSSII